MARDLGAEEEREWRPEPGAAVLTHRVLAPFVAVVASALAVNCLTSVPEAARQASALGVIDEGFLGWVGIAMLMAVATSAATVACAPSLGAGPGLSAGVAGAVFGLGLGRLVSTDAQLVLSLACLGIACGGLLTGGLLAGFEVPLRWRHACVLGWVAPLLAGWPVQAWLALHTPLSGRVRLVLAPGAWAMAGATALLVLWSVLSLLSDPVGPGGRLPSAWTAAWTGLAAIALTGGLTVTLLGFASGLRDDWLRPLVVLACVVAVVGFAATAAAVPDSHARAGYLTAVLVGLFVPGVVGLSVAARLGGTGADSAGFPLVLVVAAVLGLGLGWRCLRLAPAGVSLLVVAAAGLWAQPPQVWWAAALICLPLLASGLVVGAGLRSAARTPLGLAYVGTAMSLAVLTGVVAVTPLSWALVGRLPVGSDAAAAAARVGAGGLAAGGALIAAYVLVLRRREPPRTPPRGRGDPSLRPDPRDVWSPGN